MEIVENWNFNRKKLENTNKRNYDVEPLILRNYRGVSYLYIILSFILYLYTTMIFLASYEAIHIDFNQKLQRLIIWALVYVTFLIIPFLIIVFSKKRYIKPNHRKKAVYCFSDLTPYKNYPLIGRVEFVSVYHATMEMKWVILIFCAIMFLNGFDFEAIISLILAGLALAMSILHDILFRMLIYIKSNKSLKNFWKYSQKMVIDIGWQRIPHVTKEGATLYFFSEKDHDELKEYFLAVLNIDLDNDIEGAKFFY